jgi:dTDP-glucose 4,6-dehydratase
MRLLVTGGAGFIGSNFVRYTLLNRPDVEITVFDKFTYASSPRNLQGIDHQIQIIAGDLNDQKLINDVVSKSDIVVNLAAETHNDNSLSEPKVFIESNINGIFTLLESVRKYEKRLHHVSTDEVFGDLPLDSDYEFNLDSPYNPSSPYSASKAAGDHLVRAWVRSFGVRATISNCSNNFGYYQHVEKLIPRIISLASNGQKPQLYGNGRNIRDWLNVMDHVEGIWAVLERGSAGVTYLFGGIERLSNLEVCQMVLSELNLSEDFIEYISDRPGHDLKYALDWSSSQAELGWSPIHPGLKESIPALVDFYSASVGK